MIIIGTNNPNSINFPAMGIHGDHGYTDDECFELIKSADIGFLHTAKRGLSLAFKFGVTMYDTMHDKHEIAEMVLFFH
jgi:hypothetical protein